MSMNPVLAGVVSYSTARVHNYDVGAAVIRKGDIIKTPAAMVAAADNDKQGTFFVALEYAPANGTVATNTGVTAVPLADCTLRIAYTGSTPTVGASYGISDSRTLDQGDTTNYLLTVLAVNSTEGYALVKEYQLSS